MLKFEKWIWRIKDWRGKNYKTNKKKWKDNCIKFSPYRKVDNRARQKVYCPGSLAHSKSPIWYWHNDQEDKYLWWNPRRVIEIKSEST